MELVKANGITLAVARYGNPQGRPLVLIRGLGSQLIHWPQQMIDGFVAAGLHVVTFDNRDSGLSTILPDDPDEKHEQTTGRNTRYTLADMADDVIALMDALGIPAAHILGISMGGMIAQHLAITHSKHVLTATIVMSSSGAPDLPQAAPGIRALLMSAPKSQARADVIAHTLSTDAAWASPAFPFDPNMRARLIGDAYDRGYTPAGTARQYAAIVQSPAWYEALSGVDCPTLVIHGTDDTLIPAGHGRDIADRITGAAFIAIEGMGHDLEGGAADAITAHTIGFIEDAG